ncbi:MAG: WG repeat-containing protein [Phycisphaerae bacterium]|nr:WG repeat-containing protein [Saprospiraceae bacterium]
MRLIIGFLILFSAILTDLQAQKVKQIAYIPNPKPGKQMIFQPLDRFMMFSEQSSLNAALYDDRGKQVSEAVYAKLSLYGKTGLFLAAVKESNKMLYGFLDAQGKPITAFEYDEVSNFQWGAGLCKSGSAYFLIDSLGNMRLIPGQYRKLSTFLPGIFQTLNNDGRNGLIDATGKALWPPIYANIEKTQEPNLFKVQQLEYSRQSALVNLNNEVIIPFARQVIKVHDHYIEVDTNDFSGSKPMLYFDLEGKPLAAPLPSTPEKAKRPSCIYWKDFSNGIILGLQDSVSKKPLTGLEFSKLSPEKYGLLHFERRNYETRTAGYMRYTGEIVVEKLNFLGEQLSPFDLLNYNSFRGFGRWYNENGKEILPDYFKKLASECVSYLPSINDTARVAALGVSLGGQKFGLYDRSGKALTEEIYDTLRYVNHRLFQFNNKDRKGLVNAKGQELNTVPFDKVQALNKRNSNFAYPWLHYIYKNKMGLITEEGKVVVPAEFQPYTLFLRAGKYLWAMKDDGAYVFEVL